MLYDLTRRKTKQNKNKTNKQTKTPQAHKYRELPEAGNREWMKWVQGVKKYKHNMSHEDVMYSMVTIVINIVLHILFYFLDILFIYF